LAGLLITGPVVLAVTASPEGEPHGTVMVAVVTVFVAGIMTLFDELVE
jgi:hypothetical protein